MKSPTDSGKENILTLKIQDKLRWFERLKLETFSEWKKSSISSTLESSQHLQFFCWGGQNFRNVTFYVYIWNYHGKCIKININIPMFGPVVLEMHLIFSQTKHLLSIEICS